MNYWSREPAEGIRDNWIQGDFHEQDLELSIEYSCWDYCQTALTTKIFFKNFER